ncbi:MAG: YkgJ family cysteine cluster protein [Thiothrix sp.]|uniref:YkgJ family cysteine cluster protein n=1 Tax=Thiothrix sp. TaxID=1032 RepID=UPI002624CDD9|nr:YkgJ family cysteine cluster protein [Thiothrix sp.]MDD5394730.1 YkgJ family cysteine cluster protein [Thiothrix sp.]
MNILSQLHADIEERVQAIRDGHPDWLCRMGCDSCCHRLAEIPRLTQAEWDLLCAGLTTLPPEQLQEVGQKMTALATQSSRPIVCPMLDQATGACPVYAHRPVACRTYGFYVQRGLGLYCKEMEAGVADGAWADVLWGNHDAIEHRLGSLGDTRELTTWFADWITPPASAPKTN